MVCFYFVPLQPNPLIPNVGFALNEYKKPHQGFSREAHKPDELRKQVF